MRKIFIIIVLVFLASSCKHVVSETADAPGGPTGCASAGICAPCTLGCTANRGAVCLPQNCAINIVCIDTPANCTQKCRVDCVTP